jgi:Flp pilus assembly protein TadD
VCKACVAKIRFVWQVFRMKPLLVATLLAMGVFTAHAQSSADDRYIGIYGLMQQADQLAATGDRGEALAAYTDAEKQLQQFQRAYPDWQPSIVNFRVKQLAEKIADLTAQLPPPATTTNGSSNPSPSTNTVATADQANEALAGQLSQLRARLQAELAANETLQAKLKEALSVQPAAVDPRELAAAQEKIRGLMKENDLLKASRGAGQPLARTIYVTNLVKVIVTNYPVEVTNLAAVFDQHPAPTIVTNYIRVVDTNALEAMRLSRAAAVRNFNEEHDRAEQLANELTRLRAAAASAGSPGAGTNAVALTTLQAENAALRQELDVLRAAQTAAAGSGDLAGQLQQARAQIAELQSEARINALEKLALERKLKAALASTNNAGTASVAYETRIGELTRERDDLLQQLHRTGQPESGSPGLTAKVASLNSEVATLRSRLAVVESQPSPYTADELAFFKTGAAAALAASEKSVAEMPADTAELVASAQQHFAKQEFDQAEADYQKILGRDQNNGIALANLAMIELQEGKLDQAEKHITAALAKSPNDAYNLTTLGYLRLRQEKYDAALDALSRAAQLDPNNPEIQNYLGVTLGHLGQRKAAEAALRRAVEINANYAPAHNNLAAIYLSQEPPLATLARWHYQKAIEAGMPRNPDMEKKLAESGAPVQP